MDIEFRKLCEVVLYIFILKLAKQVVLVLLRSLYHHFCVLDLDFEILGRLCNDAEAEKMQLANIF